MKSVKVPSRKSGTIGRTYCNKIQPIETFVESKSASDFTWNFHLCPNGEISQNSLSCPMVHKAWKGMKKAWEFCSCPLIANGIV